MKLLLDSDVINALSSPKSEQYQQIRSFIESFNNPPYIYLSTLTIMEIEFNIASFKSDEDREAMRQSLDTFLSHFNLVDISLASARIYGEMKQGLRERTGINKNALKRHNIDIALASIAIANDYVLVSRDKIYSEHLQKIDPNLKHSAW